MSRFISPPTSAVFSDTGHTSRTGRPNAGRSTSSTPRSPLDHTSPPQPPQHGRRCRHRTCTRNRPPAASSTPSTSTSPSPTSNSQTRVGSHSTGILPIRLSKQRRFWGIPRVQPRTLTPPTAPSFPKSPFTEVRALNRLPAVPTRPEPDMDCDSPRNSQGLPQVRAGIGRSDPPRGRSCPTGPRRRMLCLTKSGGGSRTLTERRQSLSTPNLARCP